MFLVLWRDELIKKFDEYRKEDRATITNLHERINNKSEQIGGLKAEMKQLESANRNLIEAPRETETRDNPSTRDAEFSESPDDFNSPDDQEVEGDELSDEEIENLQRNAEL